MKPPTVRRVRYEDFVALISGGVGDRDGFRAAVDVLRRDMGSVDAHHVLFDLRRATIPPLPEIILVQALEHLRRQGLGVANKVAVVTDPADKVRSDRADAFEAIAAHMLMHVRGFRDYGQALDWLSEQPEASAGD